MTSEETNAYRYGGDEFSYDYSGWDHRRLQKMSLKSGRAGCMKPIQKNSDDSGYSASVGYAVGKLLKYYNGTDRLE